MSRKGIRLLCLCEDDEHWRLARSSFLALGYHSRELRVSLAPTGRGAAEEWVRQQYAEEVRAHRGRATHQKIGLLVVIDADRQTVDYRHRQLAETLGESSIQERGPVERIAVWVPKRHIETWVADLVSAPANEEDDYRNAMRDADYRRAGESFVERYRSKTNRNVVGLPSMSRAFAETDRLRT